MAFIKNILFILQSNLTFFGFLAFLFLAVSIVVGSVIFLFIYRDVASERLKKLTSAAILFKKKKNKIQLIDDDSASVIKKVTKTLHHATAPRKEEEAKGRKFKLIQAGFRSQGAYRTFFAAKIVLFVLLPSLYLFISSVYNLTSEVTLMCIIIAGTGFFIPDIVILHYKLKRQEIITKALPDAIDLMVICVTAGLGLDMTFNRVGQEIRPHCQDLSDEFSLTNLEIRAGKSREESYKNMARRTDVPEVRSLMNMLNQTNRFGTNVSDSLRVHADSMRIKRRQIAEEKAAKSAVKLILPLILFIFPAIMIVLVGPAGIKIAKDLLPALGGGG